ncbi:MAG: hypothetical protein Q8859_13595 [Bacteroidota bacterium]|nr:hypothetical protein [Bacteroidota bacterium]
MDRTFIESIKKEEGLTNLQRCVIEKWQVWQWTITRKGYWPIAGSPILVRVINNDNLGKASYLFLSDYYRKISS